MSVTKPKGKLHVGTYVPTEWKEKILKRVREKGYASIGEYLRDLIREDLERAGLLADLPR